MRIEKHRVVRVMALKEKLHVLFIENILQKFSTTDFIQGLGGHWLNYAENTIVIASLNGCLATPRKGWHGFKSLQSLVA